MLHDKVFWQAAKNTGILMVVALPATVALSLMFALLINAIKRLKGMFQALFFLFERGDAIFRLIEAGKVFGSNVFVRMENIHADADQTKQEQGYKQWGEPRP